jgi:hypothetical protein
MAAMRPGDDLVATRSDTAPFAPVAPTLQQTGLLDERQRYHRAMIARLLVLACSMVAASIPWLTLLLASR